MNALSFPSSSLSPPHPLTMDWYWQNCGEDGTQRYCGLLTVIMQQCFFSVCVCYPLTGSLAYFYISSPLAPPPPTSPPLSLCLSVCLSLFLLLCVSIPAAFHLFDGSIFLSNRVRLLSCESSVFCARFVVVCSCCCRWHWERGACAALGFQRRWKSRGRRYLPPAIGVDFPPRFRSSSPAVRAEMYGPALGLKMGGVDGFMEPILDCGIYSLDWSWFAV